MSTKQFIGIALLIAGVVLLFLGYQSSQGMDDQISEALTGEYTDSTVAYYIGGAISAVVGIVLLIGRK